MVATKWLRKNKISEKDILRIKKMNIFAVELRRGVAQLASALAWGASGRPFESDHPDQKRKV